MIGSCSHYKQLKLLISYAVVTIYFIDNYLPLNTAKHSDL